MSRAPSRESSLPISTGSHQQPRMISTTEEKIISNIILTSSHIENKKLKDKMIRK